MGFLDALRRNNNGPTDAMRQTTTLTMAYLLEQNRQFEAYMREKVEELEARVTAQQARASVKVGDADEATRPLAPVEVLDRTQPVVPMGEVDDDLLSLFSADFELDEAEEEAAVVLPEPAVEVEAKLEVEAEETAPPEWTNWETALLGPPAGEVPPVTEAALPAEALVATGEPAAEGETEIATAVPGLDEADEWNDSFLSPWLQVQVAKQPVDEVEVKVEAAIEQAASVVGGSDISQEKETEPEDTEVTLLLAVGPVKDWA